MSGPYRIRFVNHSTCYVDGPTETMIAFARGDADRLCNWLNAAYAAGLAASGRELETARLRKIEDAANFLLVWTYQGDIIADPADKWRVSDLHPSVWNKMNSAEQDLYHALRALTPTEDKEYQNAVNALLRDETKC